MVRSDRKQSVHLVKGQPLPPNAIVLQGPVPGLVLGEYVLALAQLLPQVGHLLAEGRVLLLQERSPDGDLVLLQAPGVARALRCHVVLSAPCPVLVILLISYRRKKKQDIRFQQSAVSARGTGRPPGCAEAPAPGGLTCASSLDSLRGCEEGPWTMASFLGQGPTCHTRSYALCPAGYVSHEERSIGGRVKASSSPHALNHIPNFSTLFVEKFYFMNPSLPWALMCFLV